MECYCPSSGSVPGCRGVHHYRAVVRNGVARWDYRGQVVSTPDYETARREAARLSRETGIPVRYAVFQDTVIELDPLRTAILQALQE